MKSIIYSLLSLPLMAALSSAPTFGQDLLNGKVISGDVSIAGDVYTFNNVEVFNPEHTYLIKTSGSIKRQGLQAGKAPASGANIAWDLKFEGSLKEGGTASYGTWAGSVAATADSNNRVAYTYTLTVNNKASKIADAKFAGKVISPSRAATASTKDVTVERVSDGKKFKYSVKAESMSFSGFTIGQGPTVRHPDVKVGGEMAYEVATKDWLVNGLSFSYSLKGKPVTDKISGGMAWVGSAYEVAFLFNDDLSKGKDVVEVKSGDFKNLITASSDTPAITGRISVDANKINFDLSAQNVSEQQVMSMFKFLVSILVPINS